MIILDTDVLSIVQRGPSPEAIGSSIETKPYPNHDFVTNLLQSWPKTGLLEVLSPWIMEVVSTVAEIEKALQAIPLDDARKVAEWLQDYLDEKWDNQIDADIEAGRLDKLADKAIHDYHAGRVKPLDEIIDEP